MNSIVNDILDEGKLENPELFYDNISASHCQNNLDFSKVWEFDGPLEVQEEDEGVPKSFWDVGVPGSFPEAGALDVFLHPGVSDNSPPAGILETGFSTNPENPGLEGENEVANQVPAQEQQPPLQPHPQQQQIPSNTTSPLKMDSTPSYLQVEVFLKNKAKSRVHKNHYSMSHSFPIPFPETLVDQMSREFIAVTQLHVTRFLMTIPPYQDFKSAGIEFNFVNPNISYIAEDANKKVLLLSDRDLPVPQPQVTLDKEGERQIRINICMELVIHPARDPSAVERDKVLDTIISSAKSIKSTSKPKRTVKRSRTEAKDKGKSGKKSRN